MPVNAPELLAGLSQYRASPRWLVGFSGGLDSTALLDLLVQLSRSEQLPPLMAVHVNHGLSPNADAWQLHCEQVCRRLGVPLESRRVEVSNSGKGVEAAAREARYAVFEELLEPGGVVLLAHHLDDQVETFFLRLLRGAGTQGLSAMPANRALGRGILYRPLLEFSRDQLRDYAAQRQLEWVEDESNAQSGPKRNFLRREVLPLVEQRWPFRLHATYDESISRMLDVFEKVDRDIPFNGLPWFFDHAETITPRNIERVRALGGGIAIQDGMAFQGE